MDENDTQPHARESRRSADHGRGRRAAVPGVNPSFESFDDDRSYGAGGAGGGGGPGAGGPGDAGGERGKIRAGDVDRDRVVEILKTAFTEGRLTKDEYDERVANALSARTYADLDVLVADLPGTRRAMVPPVPAVVVPPPPEARINGLAIASLACGIAQFGFGPLGTIPAIVLGHMARHQIKRTGERGAGLAAVGLLLGYGAVVLGIVFLTLAVVAIQSHPQFPGQFPGPQFPQP
jgi:hypothetical protein